MIIRNEDIQEVRMEVPSGHRHLRTTVVLLSGEEIVFQEATVANIVRAFISVKTHPEKRSMKLAGRTVRGAKEGFAEWQLLED